jgi:carboxypeptidase family protein
MKRMLRYALLAAITLFALYTNLRAQSATATLSGTVTDPTGAAVAKASVTLQNTGTGIKRATSTNGEGYFTLPLLPPGNYTLTVEQPGFATITNRDVILNVGDRQMLWVQLKVGQINVAVPIESGATTINAVDATRGNAISEREVKNLPFAARNPVGLLTLQPGVVFTGQSDTDSLFQGAINKLDHREGVVNGVRGNQTNVSVDGADANDFETQAAFTSVLPVTLDSLQEFRVTTANANVTDGVAAGAQV